MNVAPVNHPLLAIAVLLLISMGASAVVRRWQLPSMTGQILAGVLVGPAALGLFDHATVQGMLPITSFALGLIAVSVGDHLHLARLRIAAGRLGLMVLTESLLIPALVFVAITAIGGAHWTLGLLLGTMAIATAPATIVALVKETRSRGVFVGTLVAAVALNNIACIALFELAMTICRVELAPESMGHPLQVLTVPLRQLGISAGLGAGVGLILILLTRNVVDPQRLTTGSLVAIMGTVGLASTLGVSPLLACVVLGIVLANLDVDQKEIGHLAFENFEGAIFAIFFTVAGMELDFTYLKPAGALALMVVVARASGKILSAWGAMTLARAPVNIRRYLGPALVPQAGVAVGLILIVQQTPFLADVKQLLLAVGLTTVTVNEIIGPLLTKLALQRSGEAGLDTPHVLEFLREECITTGVKGDSKEEVVGKLADLLVRIGRCDLDHEEIAARVMKREREASSCLGRGLAIPHFIAEGATELAGVMGVSRRGLTFPTPDGQPLHCLVLLAIPESMADAEAEILASVARALSVSGRLLSQLNHAHSPAHVCAVLQELEAESLDDLLEENT